MRNKKAGALIKFFVGIIIFCMGFMTLFLLYSDITSDYDYLNATNITEMDTLSRNVNWSFYTGEAYSLERTSSLINDTVPKDTGEAKILANAVKGAMSYIKDSFNLLKNLIPTVASALKVPVFWYRGFMAIIAISIFILIIAGFLKATVW